MKLLDENEKNEIKRGWTMTRMITWVVLFCVIIVVLVFLMNDRSTPFVPENKDANSQKQDSDLLNEQTSNDLQIWDINDLDSETVEEEQEASVSPIPTTDPNEVPEGFFRITLSNGEFETHRINTYLPLSTLSYEQFFFSGKETKYEFSGDEKSYLGIKVSEDNGYIDFHKVKKDGIDFVIIAAGSRGYGTGQIVMDDYLKTHIKNATDAKLNIGLYFKSQAINEEEAVEEANAVLEVINGYMITYPIAFEMDRIENDEGRTEGLTRIERTKIASAFLSTMKASGYDASIYGDSEFLIDDLDLSQLKSYDIWFSQEAAPPEIPYQFSLWEFSENEKVNGVVGNVKMTISLIDFEEK